MQSLAAKGKGKISSGVHACGGIGAGLLAKNGTVAAWGQIEMQMRFMIGVAAGSENGPERSARGLSDMVEKLALFCPGRRLDFDPAAIFHGERRYIERIAKCVLGQFRAIVARAADIGRSLINACEISADNVACARPDNIGGETRDSLGDIAIEFGFGRQFHVCGQSCDDNGVGQSTASF